MFCGTSFFYFFIVKWEAFLYNENTIEADYIWLHMAILRSNGVGEISARSALETRGGAYVGKEIE